MASKYPNGEVKAVIVRSTQGEIISQRRNTRRYTHALVLDGAGKEGPRVLSYHTTEALARTRHRSGECEASRYIHVVPTDIVEHAPKMDSF